MNSVLAKPVAMSPATQRAYALMCANIGSELYVPGDRIGTERELALRFAIGRNLLRQALAVLESEGRVKRLIGRSGGIIVSDGKVDRPLNSLLSLPAMLRRQGFIATTTTLAVVVTSADAEVARALGIRVNDPVVRIRRLRYANGNVLSLETTHVSSVRFPQLTRYSFDDSLYDLLRTRYGVAPISAEERIEARAATIEESEMLDFDDSGVVFEIRRISRDARGNPIEHAIDVFRADRTRINVVALQPQVDGPRVADPQRKVRNPTSPN